MSYTLDANILLYASDRKSPFRAAAREFLRERPRDLDVLFTTA